MPNWNAIGGLAVKVLGTYADWNNKRKSAIAEGDVMRQQASNAIKNMNYAFMNYEEERRDSFEQSVALIQKNTLNTRTLNSAVRASVGEEQADSRTGNALVRASNAEAFRSKTRIQDNYRRKSNEIDLNKEAQLINTKTYIDGLHPPTVPSKFSAFVSLIPTLIQDYTMNEELKATEYAKTGVSRSPYTNALRAGTGKTQAEYDKAEANSAKIFGHQFASGSLTRANLGNAILLDSVPDQDSVSYDSLANFSDNYAPSFTAVGYNPNNTFGSSFSVQGNNYIDALTGRRKFIDKGW